MENGKKDTRESAERVHLVQYGSLAVFHSTSREMLDCSLVRADKRDVRREHGRRKYREHSRTAILIRCLRERKGEAERTWR
jgi:hypothetical protein